MRVIKKGTDIAVLDDGTILVLNGQEAKRFCDDEAFTDKLLAGRRLSNEIQVNTVDELLLAYLENIKMEKLVEKAIGVLEDRR